MIPPTFEVRLRSIRRWLKDQQPERFARLTRSGELESAMMEHDEQMDEAFEELENEVIDQLMRQNRWGTQEGTQEFHMRRLMAWQEVCGRFLPVISEDNTEI